MPPFLMATSESPRVGSHVDREVLPKRALPFPPVLPCAQGVLTRYAQLTDAYLFTREQMTFEADRAEASTVPESDTEDNKALADFDALCPAWLRDPRDSGDTGDDQLSAMPGTGQSYDDPAIEISAAQAEYNKALADFDALCPAWLRDPRDPGNIAKFLQFQKYFNEISHMADDYLSSMPDNTDKSYADRAITDAHIAQYVDSITSKKVQGISNGTPWTEAEDNIIRKGVQKYLPARIIWGDVIKELPGRNAKVARCRWKRMNEADRAFRLGILSRNRCKKCGQLRRGHSCPYV